MILILPKKCVQLFLQFWLYEFRNVYAEYLKDFPDSRNYLVVDVVFGVILPIFYFIRHLCPLAYLVIALNNHVAYGCTYAYFLSLLFHPLGNSYVRRDVIIASNFLLQLR